jgi:hypothetical protein
VEVEASMLQILFYIAIGNIGENVWKYWKLSASINLDLRNLEKLENIGNLKNTEKFGNIRRNQRYLQHC